MKLTISTVGIAHKWFSRHDGLTFVSGIVTEEQSPNTTLQNVIISDVDRGEITRMED